MENPEPNSSSKQNAMMGANIKFVIDPPESSNTMPRHQDDEEVDPLHTVGVSRNSEESNYSQASNPPRQSAEPLAAVNRVSDHRYPALEMWQMDDIADKRERAASIPSRAWIPFMDSLGGQGDGDGSATSASHTLADTSPTEHGDEAETHVHSMRKMASRAKSSRQKSVVLGEFGKCTGRAQPDGRMSITVHDTAHTGYIANAVGAVKHSMQSKRKMTAAVAHKDVLKLAQIPQKLNIVIMVVGSRGDVQPFFQIGKHLKEDYHNRVRIATHPIFRDVVERQAGLEFFSVGGDPSELMEFMVKNPGRIPTFRTVKAGEIGKRRAAMATMLDRFWRACIHATEDDVACLKANASAPNAFGGKDIFIANAIIANPPSFAHIHYAEALGIPLHLVFTFPYTPTRAFPHPLANVKGNTENVKDRGYANFISYPLIKTITWQGLGDLINNFRVRTLALDAVSTF